MHTLNQNVIGGIGTGIGMDAGMATRPVVANGGARRVLGAPSREGRADGGSLPERAECDASSEHRTGRCERTEERSVRRTKYNHPKQMELPFLGSIVPGLFPADVLHRTREDELKSDRKGDFACIENLLDKLYAGEITGNAYLNTSADDDMYAHLKDDAHKRPKKLGRPVNEEKQYANSKAGREMIKRAAELVNGDYRRMVKAEKQSDKIAEFAALLDGFVGSVFKITTEKGPKTYRIKQITKSGTIHACVHTVYVADDGREMYRETFKAVEIFELNGKGKFEIVGENDIEKARCFRMFSQVQDVDDAGEEMEMSA